jgi:CelD/BcsL family acetyltransferase involved in cellulose biosynthesis
LWPPPAGPIVAAPGDFAEAAHRLATQLRDRGDWDVLMAAALPTDAEWRDTLRAWPRAREHNRVIAFDEGMDWDRWLASRSRNFRKQTRKRDERLAERFDVRYRRTEDPARLDSDLSVLFDLHDRRYGETSTGLSRDREAFHREVAASALERGWLALWFIDLDGRAVAGNLHFRYEGIEHSYQTGRDEAFDDVNAGVALVTHTVRAAADAGMREFHFLHGDQEFKRRLATADRPVETLVISGGLMGDAALAGMAVMSRAESLLTSLPGIL